jgi:hypothetical protein
VVDHCRKEVEAVRWTQEWFGLLFASLASRRPAMAFSGEGVSLARYCGYYNFKRKLMGLASYFLDLPVRAAAEAVLCPFDALADFPLQDIEGYSSPPRWMDKGDPAWWFVVGEVSGILNWSLDGLTRLLAQGQFTRATWYDEDFVARRKKYMAGKGRRVLSHILDQGRP